MNDKLKPCPFCGDVPRWCGENNKDPQDNHECHLISCDKCGVLFDVDNEETVITETMGELQNATKNAWNNRHCESTIKSQAERIERLEKQLKSVESLSAQLREGKELINEISEYVDFVDIISDKIMDCVK